MPQEVQEGWGFATREVQKNGESTQEIFMTDGSSNIYIADPTLKVFNTLSVRIKGVIKSHRHTHLMELRSAISMNLSLSRENCGLMSIWLTASSSSIQIMALLKSTYDVYLMISRILNLNGLQSLAMEEARSRGLEFRSDFCLNGIAYDPSGDRVLITGKKWPLMWEIEILGATN
jgi:glutamine cyclotransferase